MLLPIELVFFLTFNSGTKDTQQRINQVIIVDSRYSQPAFKDYCILIKNRDLLVFLINNVFAVEKVIRIVLVFDVKAQNFVRAALSRICTFCLRM